MDNLEAFNFSLPSHLYMHTPAFPTLDIFVRNVNSLFFFSFTKHFRWYQLTEELLSRLASAWGALIISSFN